MYALLLQDAPTRWFAANFLEQQHPLVAAMRAQVSRPAVEVWPFDDHGCCQSRFWSAREWMGWFAGIQQARMAAAAVKPAR